MVLKNAAIYKKSINATDFMLKDPSYYSKAEGYPAIIAIIADNQWLSTWDADYGDFAIRGFDTTSKLVKDVVNLRNIAHSLADDFVRAQPGYLFVLQLDDPLPRRQNTEDGLQKG